MTIVYKWSVFSSQNAKISARNQMRAIRGNESNKTANNISDKHEVVEHINSHSAHQTKMRYLSTLSLMWAEALISKCVIFSLASSKNGYSGNFTLTN